MRRVRVKVCGITREEDLKMVCNMDVDAVGFIVNVPTSPRNLTLEKAKELIRQVPVFVKSVVVTVPKNIDDVVTVYEMLRPDIIQISGELKHSQMLREKMMDVCLIKAVSVKSEESFNEAINESKFFDAILLDSYTPGKCGGTGLTHNWKISRQIRDAIHPKPIILAGGLSPENVKEAIQTVKPYAVDVSTGVESSPGIKDPAKVEAFIKNAKEISLYDD